MKFLALVSGGKDSLFAASLAVAGGHELVATAHLRPAHLMAGSSPSVTCVSNGTAVDPVTDPDVGDDLDSFMFQSVGSAVLDGYVEAMDDIPLFVAATGGTASQHSLAYDSNAANEADEVEEMLRLVQAVKEAIPDLEAVTSGAILSDYQRLRVEAVCARLGLISLAPLWQGSQARLLEFMTSSSMDIRLIKVATVGLDPNKHLGATLLSAVPALNKANAQFQVNVAGEGGEYETLVIDSPLFTKARIIIDDSEKVVQGDDPWSTSGHLHVKSWHLEAKSEPSPPITLPSSSAHFPFDPGFLQSPSTIDVDSLQQALPKPVETAVSGALPDDDGFTPSILTLTIHRSGAFFFLPAAARTGPTAAEAASDALTGIEDTLKASGLDMSDVSAVQMFLGSMADFAAVNSVFVSRFGRLSPPSRVAVSASWSAHKPTVAFSVQGRAGGRAKRSTLHVQSISHWAPACIGPYSQASVMESSGLAWTAGQIALVPFSMSLMDAPPPTQAALALLHSTRVCEAIRVNPAQSAIALWYLSPSPQEQRQNTLHAISRLWTESGLPLDRFPVLWVEVAELPRAAAVELQIIAAADPFNSNKAPDNDPIPPSTSSTSSIWTASLTHRPISDQEAEKIDEEDGDVDVAFTSAGLESSGLWDGMIVASVDPAATESDPHSLLASWKDLLSSYHAMVMQGTMYVPVSVWSRDQDWSSWSAQPISIIPVLNSGCLSTFPGGSPSNSGIVLEARVKVSK